MTPVLTGKYQFQLETAANVHGSPRSKRRVTIQGSYAGESSVVPAELWYPYSCRKIRDAREAQYPSTPPLVPDIVPQSRISYLDNNEMTNSLRLSPVDNFRADLPRYRPPAMPFVLFSTMAGGRAEKQPA